MRISDWSSDVCSSDRSIVAIAPIRQIMPALLPRPRMVRYLVARQAGGARHRLRRVEQVGGGVAVGDDELALRRQRREARARLDGELIERQMAGAEGQRRAKLRLPRRKRLAWPRIDQVETDQHRRQQYQESV